jgi:hypothetical protein
MNRDKKGLKHALRNFAVVHGIVLLTVAIAVATNHGLWARFIDDPVVSPANDSAQSDSAQSDSAQSDPPQEVQSSEDGLGGLLDGLELTEGPENGVDPPDEIVLPATNSAPVDSPLLAAFLAMRSASERLRNGDVSVVTQGDQGRAIQLLDEMIRQTEGEKNSASQEESAAQQDSSQQKSGSQQNSDQRSTEAGEPNVANDASNAQESASEDSGSEESTAQSEEEMSGGGKEGFARYRR